MGCLINYLKGKYIKGIFIRESKVLKDVMFCDYSYTPDKVTRNSVSGLVTTLGSTLLTRSSKTQRTVTVSITEAECVALSACAKEVKYVSMLFEEMTKVHKPSVIYRDNQGENFLAKSRQVGIRTKKIDTRHHFLRDMVEYKDIAIQYIWSEDNPVDIMKNNTLESDCVKHIKGITEEEL